MVQIQYWDENDICGFIYSTGFKNIVNIDADFRVREFEYSEEGSQNGDNEFIPLFQKTIKEYVSSPIQCLPSQREALEQISLHKYIRVVKSDGTNQFVKNFQVDDVAEIEERSYVAVTIKFQVSYSINRSRMISLADAIDKNKKKDVSKFADIANFNSLSQGMRVIDTTSLDVYEWDNGWIAKHENIEGNYVYVIDEDYEYYFNGIQWIESPKITTATSIVGNKYKVRGTTRNGFVRIEGTEDAGITWTILEEITSGEFRVGYKMDLLPIYDSIRPTVYTHGGIETIGDIFANPNVGDFITVTETLTSFVGEYKKETASQQIDISEGVDATTDVVITAPTNFEISEDNIVWTNTITLTAGYSNETIYIRAKAISSGMFSEYLQLVVDGKTYNVIVEATIDGTIDWIYDWINDFNGETVNARLTEKLDYATGSKEALATEINLKGGTIVPATTFRDYASQISGLGSAGWSPPAYWDWDTASALLTDSDDGFVALVAVFPNQPNYITLQLYYTGGGGTIDWGDGTTSALGASGVVNEKTLSYAGVSGSVCAKGYKIATVKIIITGTLTYANYARSHSLLYNSRPFSTPYLAIKQRSQNASMIYIHNNPQAAGMLELLDLGTDSEIDPSHSFKAHSALQKLTWKAQTTAYSAENLFGPSEAIGFASALDVDVMDWTVCTSMKYAFYSAGGNLGVFEKSIDNNTDLRACWHSSRVHNSVILTNSGNVEDIGYAAYKSALSYFSMDDASGVTSTTSFVRTSSEYNALTGLILTGLPVGIDISYSPMDATAIDAFFTSLGAANGAQTITVTGCPGAGTCDTSIATAKGFTVVT